MGTRGEGRGTVDPGSDSDFVFKLLLFYMGRRTRGEGRGILVQIGLSFFNSYCCWVKRDEGRGTKDGHF